MQALYFMYFVIDFLSDYKNAIICCRVRMDVLFCNFHSNGNQHWRWHWGNLACGWMSWGYLFIYLLYKETIKTTPMKAIGLIVYICIII